MSRPVAVDIGWLPVPFDATVGDLAVATLPDLDAAVRAVREDEGVDGGWIYAPPCQRHVMGHGVRTLPYPCRVFGLPRTHRLTHAAADGETHLAFLTWAMSFVFGLRLTATERGFLDATPAREGMLTDFVLDRTGRRHALALAERFWRANAAGPARAKRWGAAVHALMLGQGPQLLQFERFLHLYGALDTCFALARDLLGPVAGRRLPHAGRIAWMCRQFGMPVPAWADDAVGGRSLAADLRNPALHESLYMGAPLGFAVQGVGGGENLTLAMTATICRLLVALLGDPDSGYVRTPVDTRQRHRWTPPG